MTGFNIQNKCMKGFNISRLSYLCSMYKNTQHIQHIYQQGCFIIHRLFQIQYSIDKYKSQHFVDIVPKKKYLPPIPLHVFGKNSDKEKACEQINVTYKPVLQFALINCLYLGLCYDNAHATRFSDDLSIIYKSTQLHNVRFSNLLLSSIL